MLLRHSEPRLLIESEHPGDPAYYQVEFCFNAHERVLLNCAVSAQSVDWTEWSKYLVSMYERCQDRYGFSERCIAYSQFDCLSDAMQFVRALFNRKNF